jgi:hypothetical protein
MTPLSGHRHLDPETLARLAGLQLRVNAVMEGTLAGLHRSPHHGSSIEFAEHKEYSPGDDLRHLDWKAFGKFDRYYVKRFENETELRAYLMLDCSGSMGYGEPLTKLEYSSILVACLAHLLNRQGDQTGLVVFDEKVRRYVPPRASTTHLAEVLDALDKVAPSGGTDLAGAIRYLTEVIGHRTLTVLASDLFDTGGPGGFTPAGGSGPGYFRAAPKPEGHALRLLRHLRARRHHVVLLHVLHPDELQFPFSDLTLFESMEDTAQVLVDPAGIRKRYLAEIGRFLDETRQQCLAAEIDYHLVSIAEPPHEVLLRFISAGGSARR